VTGDALLTQRALARYLIKRPEHYYFTVRKTDTPPPLCSDHPQVLPETSQSIAEMMRTIEGFVLVSSSTTCG
jgi:hypothetical protein